MSIFTLSSLTLVKQLSISVIEIMISFRRDELQHEHALIFITCAKAMVYDIRGLKAVLGSYCSLFLLKTNAKSLHSAD